MVAGPRAHPQTGVRGSASAGDPPPTEDGLRRSDRPLVAATNSGRWRTTRCSPPGPWAEGTSGRASSGGCWRTTHERRRVGTIFSGRCSCWSCGIEPTLTGMGMSLGGRLYPVRQAPCDEGDHGAIPDYGRGRLHRVEIPGHTLAERQDTVRILDDFSGGRATNLEGIHDRVEIVRGDLRDPWLWRAP